MGLRCLLSFFSILRFSRRLLVITSLIRGLVRRLEPGVIPSAPITDRAFTGGWSLCRARHCYNFKTELPRVWERLWRVAWRWLQRREVFTQRLQLLRWAIDEVAQQSHARRI